MPITVRSRARVLSFPGPAWLSASSGAALTLAAVWALTLARLGKRAALAGAAATVVLILGEVYWTFAEYAVQRWWYRVWPSFTRPARQDPGR